MFDNMPMQKNQSICGENILKRGQKSDRTLLY